MKRHIVVIIGAIALQLVTAAAVGSIPGLAPGARRTAVVAVWTTSARRNCECASTVFVQKTSRGTASTCYGSNLVLFFVYATLASGDCNAQLATAPESVETSWRLVKPFRSVHRGGMVIRVAGGTRETNRVNY